SGAAGSTRSGRDGDRRRADAPLRLELLHELGDLDDGEVGKVIDDLLFGNFSHDNLHAVPRLPGLGKRGLGVGAASDGSPAALLALLRREHADEVLGRRVQQHDELLSRRHHGREQLSARLVLVRQGRELLLDGLAGQDLSLEQAGLDLELLVRFTEVAEHARRGARLLVAPRHARHADEHVIELVDPGLVRERLLNERVLDDAVGHALVAERVPELRDLLDRHPGEVQEHGGGHPVELGPDVLDGIGFLRPVHQRSSSPLAAIAAGSIHTPEPMVLGSVRLLTYVPFAACGLFCTTSVAAGSIRTPGPMVLESVMLLRYVPFAVGGFFCTSSLRSATVFSDSFAWSHDRRPTRQCTTPALSTRYSTLPAFASRTAVLTSKVTVPTFGFGMRPRGPSTRPSLPTAPIMSGVAMTRSKSRKPSWTRCTSSSPPATSAPASSASRSFSPR